MKYCTNQSIKPSVNIVVNFPQYSLKSVIKIITLTEKNDRVVSLLHRVNVSPCGEGKTKYPGRSRIKNINLHCTMWNTMTYPLLVFQKKLSCQFLVNYNLNFSSWFLRIIFKKYSNAASGKLQTPQIWPTQSLCSVHLRIWVSINTMNAFISITGS